MRDLLLLFWSAAVRFADSGLPAVVGNAGTRRRFASISLLRQCEASPSTNSAKLWSLAALPDARIDLSDIPEARDWSRAVVGKFYRPIKKSITVRLDADVLAWLKSRGKGYQTRINRLLRAAMEDQPRHRRRA